MHNSPLNFPSINANAALPRQLWYKSASSSSFLLKPPVNVFCVRSIRLYLSALFVGLLIARWKLIKESSKFSYSRKLKKKKIRRAVTKTKNQNSYAMCCWHSYLKCLFIDNLKGSRCWKSCSIQSHALTLYMCFICPYLSPKFDLKKKEFLKKKKYQGRPWSGQKNLQLRTFTRKLCDILITEIIM